MKIYHHFSRTKQESLRKFIINCDDVIFHPISSNNTSLLLLYISGLADDTKIDENIIKPLLKTELLHLELDVILTYVTNVSNTKILKSTLEIIDQF